MVAMAADGAAPRKHSLKLKGTLGAGAFGDIHKGMWVLFPRGRYTRPGDSSMWAVAVVLACGFHVRSGRPGLYMIPMVFFNMMQASWTARSWQSRRFHRGLQLPTPKKASGTLRCFLGRPKCCALAATSKYRPSCSCNTDCIVMQDGHPNLQPVTHTHTAGCRCLETLWMPVPGLDRPHHSIPASDRNC